MYNKTSGPENCNIPHRTVRQSCNFLSALVECDPYKMVKRGCSFPVSVVLHHEGPREVKGLDDQRYMEALYHQFKRLMYATAGKYAAGAEDREDLVQSALVRLVKKLPTLRSMEHSAQASYIVFTVRSVAIDALRKGSRQVSGVSLEGAEALQVPDEGLTMDEYMLARERSERLRVIWPRLGEEDRLLLEGKYLHDCSDRELAQLLGCQVDSVRMKLTRARRKALKWMTEGEVEP